MMKMQQLQQADWQVLASDALMAKPTAPTENDGKPSNWRSRWARQRLTPVGPNSVCFVPQAMIGKPSLATTQPISAVEHMIAVAAAMVVFLVALRVLRRQRLGNPAVLACCVAGLTFLALASQPAGVIGFILLPYAALGLTLLLLWALLLLARLWSLLRHDRHQHRAFQDPIRQFLNWLNNHNGKD